MKVLVTGGAGYIGSTVCSALEDNGHQVIVLDSLVKGSPTFVTDKIFYKGDISDKNILLRLLSEHPDISAVIHCAARIIVPESVEKPYLYYKDNVAKSLEFFKHLSETNINRIVFSSSASIYEGDSGCIVTEESPINPTSPYAKTKLATEMVLEDFCRAYGMHGISLRYFNPIGADPKMRSGPYDKLPTHIFGKLLSVSDKSEDLFEITGYEWPTRDGTGIRDYLHVWDLALAHVNAIENFDVISDGESSFMAINIGTGIGTTVMEFIKAFEEVRGLEIPQKKSHPRPGDNAGVFASNDKAKRILDWTPRMSLEQGIADGIKWSNKNITNESG